VVGLVTFVATVTNQFCEAASILTWTTLHGA
jgi:hypothetical protein